MKIMYYYPKTDNWEELMHIVCKCGHALYMHGFTIHKSMNIFTGEYLDSDELWVSQCVSMKDGEYCSCKEFE